MKVRPSIKKMCDKCKIVKRKGRVRVRCRVAWRESQVLTFQGISGLR